MQCLDQSVGTSCISASSAQSERDFSSIGNTINDVLSRLSAKTVECIELVRGDCEFFSHISNHVDYI